MVAPSGLRASISSWFFADSLGYHRAALAALGALVTFTPPCPRSLPDFAFDRFPPALGHPVRHRPQPRPSLLQRVRMHQRSVPCPSTCEGTGFAAHEKVHATYH